MATCFSFSEWLRVRLAKALEEVSGKEEGSALLLRRSHHLVEDSAKLYLYEQDKASYEDRVLIQVVIDTADTEESEVPAYSVVVKSELFGFDAFVVAGEEAAAEQALEGVVARVIKGVAYLNAAVGQDSDAYEALVQEGVFVKAREQNVPGETDEAEAATAEA